MTNLQHQAFKYDYNGLVGSIITPILIDEATLTRKRPVSYITVNGLWDTGANSSVIVPKVAKALNLIPFGKVTVRGVNSEEDANIYLVDLVLPNHVIFPNARVTESDFCGGDMLIGMDIIQNGDFCISNGNGQTSFSYAIPPYKNKTCLYEKSLKVNKRNFK